MAMYLKNFDITSANCLNIIQLINDSGGEARIVGGAVRDYLLGQIPKDIDIATTLTPTQLIKLFIKNEIKVLPTGIKHGTVTVFMENESIEITTLRKDVACDGRHAEVEFTTSFEEDASRRDFTINAMSYCTFHNVVYDYFGGLRDIRKKILRFIGDPEKRILEDHLRILRFFRFSFRFARALCLKGFDACIKHKDTLKLLSKERIKLEMDNILSLTDNFKVMDALDNSGILNILYPFAEYDTESYRKTIDSLMMYDCTEIITPLYASIFRKHKNLQIKDLMDLRFSRKESTIIVGLVKISNIDESQLIPELKLKWLEHEDYALYFIISQTVITKETKILGEFIYLKYKKKPVMPLNGEDLMKLGITGEEIGKTITRLKYKWVESDFILTKDALIKLLNH